MCQPEPAKLSASCLHASVCLSLMRNPKQWACRPFLDFHEMFLLSELRGMCRHESGEYYAIDLGGTNLRVLYARLGSEPKTVVRL